MKIYRIHSTVVYPNGHPIKEQMVQHAGSSEHTRAREHKVTTWDVVAAPDCEEAIRIVRAHHEFGGASLVIWSVNHIAEITIPVKGNHA